MSSDIYFNVPSWFLENVHVKPYFNFQHAVAPPPLKLTYYAEPELSFSSQGCDPLTRPNKHRNKEALEAGLLSYD